MDNDVPKHQKKSVPSRHKKWGLRVWSYWFKQYWLPQWYSTEKARDAAYNNLISKAKQNKTMDSEHRPLIKVER
jgi:hypothetical protein